MEVPLPPNPHQDQTQNPTQAPTREPTPNPNRGLIKVLTIIQIITGSIIMLLVFLVGTGIFPIIPSFLLFDENVTDGRLAPIAPILHLLGPLLPPLTLGVFLKLRKPSPFALRPLFLFMTGCFGLRMAAWVWSDVFSLWSWTGEDDALEICGTECLGSWVEIVLLGVVGMGQRWGWRWDFGVLDWWIEKQVQESRKAERRRREQALRWDIEQRAIRSEIEDVVVKRESSSDVANMVVAFDERDPKI